MVTNVVRNGRTVVGYGFNSNGRYGQGGLIRERFAPRMLETDPTSLLDASGDNLDPDRVWAAMMRNEKPGGHGDRSVAVGTIDMAVGRGCVTVYSQVMGGAIVSPRLMLLDDSGRLLRAVSPAAFQSNFGRLRADLRLEAPERILVVVADTVRLGQMVPIRLTAKQDGRFQIAARGGVIFIPIVIPGPATPQAPQGLIIALNGLITVTASPVKTRP